MTRRSKILTILILLILAILLLIFFLINNRPQVTPTPEEPAIEIQPDPVAPVVERESILIEEEPPSASVSSLRSLAKTFTERYGSFSTEANFANIIDLYPVMTPAFRAQQEEVIASFEPTGEFYAVTTRFISAEVEEAASGDQATVTVSVQREESIGSAQNSELKYQNLVLEFVRSGENWLVDVAVWEDINR